MMTSHLDVLIVGAGPVGLALACHLRRLGLTVRVLDKKAGPSTTSKAIALQYRVSEVLNIMGVVDRFLARGSTSTRLNMYCGERRVLQLDVGGFGDQAGRDAFAPRAIMLPQNETEDLLLDLLKERGGEVEWNTEFIRFRQAKGCVISRVMSADDGTEELIVSDWLVSCEGAHSIIRKQAGLTFEGKTYPQTFYMADVEITWDRVHGEHHVWAHPEGSYAALSLPRPNTWRLFIEVPQQSRTLKGPLTLADIRAVLHRRMGANLPLITNPTWISEFRINCRMVNHFRQGRVLLAGDAAHIHSPNGGQGIVTGIQDATNLAWKLARIQAGAPDSLLDTYEEERLPKARDVLRATNRATGLFTSSNPLLSFVRDWLILPMMRMKWVQKRIFTRFAQLHVNYRGCRLSRHEDASWFTSTTLKAGDRAPDVAFRKPGGELTTLFRLLEPLRPVALIGITPETDLVRLDRLLTLLDEHDIDAHVLGPTGLSDVHGDFQRLYGMTGEFLCLIRPDDHIGLFQRPIREENLRAYLAQLGGMGVGQPATADV
jgi:4,5-epoxidase